MTTIASRRAVIGAAGLVATVAAIPAFAEHAPGSATNPRIRRAIRLHDALDAQSDRFFKEVEEPVGRALDAALAAYPAEARPPHEVSNTTFVNTSGEVVRLSTEGVGTAAVALRVIHDPSWADYGDEDWRQAFREIGAAHERRNKIIVEQDARHEEFKQETRIRFRIREIATRSDQLFDRKYAMWLAVIATPAASVQDIVTKLDFLQRTAEEDQIDAHVFEAISADIRRLAVEVPL